MSLYRTWRPLSFADLVGQDAVVRTLSAALESGRLAHAYLFSGPRGSGKTSAAKILARCINCERGPTATPDNTCENCLAMIAGTSLDVLEIDAASHRGIEEIRSLRDAVKFAPASMRMKVYVIDEAHMLTKEGANAFLKTLEEPPAHAVFILATTEPEKLPVTILSRCQRYAFRRISIPVMIEKMQTIAAAEGIGIEPAALAAIAYRADGGLRDALTMLEQAAAFAGDGAIAADTLDLAFGSTGHDVALQLVDAVLARDAAAALLIVESAADSGTDMQVLARTLVAALRNLMIARIDPELLARDLAPEDALRATGRAGGVPMAFFVRALRGLTEALALARSGGNPRLELETALLRLILTGEDATLEGMSARIAALEERIASGPALATPAAAAAVVAAPVAASAVVAAPVAAAPARATAPPKRAARAAQSSAALPAPDPAVHVAKGSLSLTQVRAAWPSIRSKAGSEHHPLQGPLSGVMVDELDRDRLTVTARSAVDADIVRERIALLEAAAADVLDTPIRISVRAPSGRPPTGSAPGGVASVTADDDVDALFNYASERIREP